MMKFLLTAVRAIISAVIEYFAKKTFAQRHNEMKWEVFTNDMNNNGEKIVSIVVFVVASVLAVVVDELMEKENKAKLEVNKNE